MLVKKPGMTRTRFSHPGVRPTTNSDDSPGLRLMATQLVLGWIGFAPRTGISAIVPSDG